MTKKKIKHDVTYSWHIVADADSLSHVVHAAGWFF
jgi:hypothetical protein